MPIEPTQTNRPQSSNRPPPPAAEDRLAADRQSTRPASDAHARPGGGSRSRVNVAPIERVASALAGGLLLRRAVRRPSLGSLAAGAAGGTLLHRGVTGHCAGYERLGISTARSTAQGASSGPAVLERSVTISAAPAEIERALRDPETLSTIMAPYASVEPTGAGARWSVSLPFGREISWETRSLEPRPDEPLRWQTVEGARAPHQGSIRMRPAPGDLGTEVSLRVALDPSTGAAGLARSRLIRMVPTTAIGAALRRLKSLIEAGEVPTTDRNPSARARAERQPG